MPRATWKLVALPFVRMPVGMSLIAMLWLALLVLVPFVGPAMLFGVGMVSWIGGMLLGLTARTLMRADTLLLPRFRRHLAMAGTLYAAATIGVPVVLGWVAGANAHVLTLAAAGLLFAVALGLSAGTGLRVGLFAWIIFPLAGLLPQPVQTILTEVVMHSPWVPVLAAMLAALLLDYSLRPLLVVSDRQDDESPMQAVADGRKTTNTTASGTPRRRGAIGRRLAAILDRTAQRNLARALQRFTRAPGAASRMHLVRSVLLPHDSLPGIVVNISVIIAAALLYLLIIPDARQWNVGVIGGYAVIIGMSRFAAVGQGMVKMRPNLADLYMTLGPATHREFQATMADALLWLVAVAVFNALAFTVLIIVMLNARTPGELLLASLIVGVGAAFGSLAAHLIGPTSKGGRMAVQFVLMGVVIGVYMLVLWLMHRFGVLIGGFAGLVICLPFGLGAWHTARRIYLGQRPCFEAPLE